MIECTFAACDSCGAEGDIQLPPIGSCGPLICPNCGGLLSTLSVTPWRELIERRVAEMTAKLARGEIGTRRQSVLLSDLAIDRDGREAELAACLILCPGQRHRWWRTAGPNRGNDLPSSWTGLPKPVEVKQTRYCDDVRGYLLVRPPRNTPGPMLADYVDDCLYVLMHGQNGLYHMLGWTDRDGLLSRGQLNPVPLRPGQRECWGIHWQRLNPVSSLVLYWKQTKAENSQDWKTQVVERKCL